VVIGPLDLRCDRNLFSNSPHKSRELTGNGYGDDVRMLASRHELAVAFAQPDLGFPADVLDHFGLFFASQLPMSADLGGIAVGPGAFHERPSGMGVASFGDRALVASLTGRIF
jgi:hypothetical protein